MVLLRSTFVAKPVVKLLFGQSQMKGALHEKSHARTISLCNLCVLCVSVVVFLRHSLTTEAQSSQRLHREEPVNSLFVRSRLMCFFVPGLTLGRQGQAA